MQTDCTIPDCHRSVFSRSMCKVHYQRWYKHGDPLFTQTPHRVVGTPEQRFLAKVQKTETCWIWMGAHGRGGYGDFRIGSTRDKTRRVVQAHRWSYEYYVGQIGDGLEIDHLCRVPACVRPDHLEPVTHDENMDRKHLA